MKNMNRILILVICLLLMAVISGAASAQQQCICLDASGLPYTQRPADSTLCYQKTADGQLVLVETLTYKQCETMNNAWLQQQELLRQQAEEAARQKAAAEEAARQKAAAEEAARQKAAAEEAARLAAEQAAAEEAARLAAEQAAAEEAARLAAEQAAADEAARLAAEQAAAEEAARLAAEQAAAEEAARLAAEQAAADEAARLAAEQAAAEEAARLAAEQAAADETARLAAEQAAAEEAARLAAEQAAADEAARLAAEQAAADEAARLAAEQAAADETARLAAEQAAADEAARLAAEQAAADEAARLAAEQAAADEAARAAQAEAEAAQRQAEEAARAKAEAEAAQNQIEEAVRAAQTGAETEAQRQAEEDGSNQAASVEMFAAAGASLPAAESDIVIPVQVGETRSDNSGIPAGAEIVNSENKQPLAVVPVVLGGDPLPVGIVGQDDDLNAEPQIRTLNQDRQVSVVPVLSAPQNEGKENQASDDGLLISPLSVGVDENQIPVPVITTLRSSGEVLSKSGIENTDFLTKDSDTLSEGGEDLAKGGTTPTENAEPSKTENVIPAENTEPSKTEGVTPAENTESSKTEGVTPAENTEPSKTEGVTPAENTESSKTEGVTPAENTESSKTEGVTPAENTEPSKTEGVTPAENTEPSKTEGLAPADDTIVLSETALTELNNLLTEEQVKDLKSFITAEWLAAHADALTADTYAELSKIVQPEDIGPANGSGSGKEGPVIPSDGSDEKPVEKEDDASNPFVGLSEAAQAELNNLLTEEQMKDLKSVITAEWLDEHAPQLSAETADELSALVPQKPGVMLKALHPSVSIEGDLTGIQLSTPNGGTVTTANVPFVWTYQYNESTPKMDVQFILSLAIKTDKDTVNLSTTVSSAACSDSICKYTADLGSYKSASVTWNVSGVYESGGSTHTVPSAGSRSFTLNIPDPTPTPTATMTPTQTPTPTMTPTSTSTPTTTPTATPKPKPKAPVQECPKGRYIVRNLGFYWAPSENAESYLVEWWNNKGQKGSLTLSNSDVTCQNKRCIANATLPGVGYYSWTVTAKNASGTARSGEMKFEIASNITTPQAYRPDGTIVNRTYPSFEWEDVRDGAIEYRIQVVGKYDSRIRMDRWYSVKDIYVGKGLCYVKTDLFLPAGTYSWRVQARNKDFSSGWSAWRDFYVECDYCNYNNVYYNTYANTVPSCSYPVGTITVNKPEFQWRTLTGASYYMVKLLDSAGKTLFENQVPSSNCTIELCKWTPNYTLTKNGNYTWSVAGYGGNGALWNIAYGSFTYQGKPVMKPMSYLRPAQNGYLTDEAPVILWTDPGEAAALFHIEIFSNAGAQLFSADLNREQAWCDGNTCSIEFKTIPDANNYRITVTPYSEFNTKGDMISLVFSKGGRILKLSSPKEGATVSTRPMFRWPLENGESTAYELLLTDAQNNVTTISPLVCGAVGVTCEGGEAFYSPAAALPVGTYTVRLSAAGINAISEEVHITVK